MADKYILRVTAGPTYDLDDHVEVPVNTTRPVAIRHDLMDIEVGVHVQNYAGLPRGSPSTSAYFSAAPHARNGDQYSIAVRFTPRAPTEPTPAGQGGGISGADLQFGNDFDHPIRDRLPPGFGTALNIVRWWIDPGLDGDAYADKPYLYGPLLSSANTVRVGGGAAVDEARGGLWVDEGGDDDGVRQRAAWGVPEAAKARMKWALRGENKDKWTWEYGREYAFDFFNPYLDFSDFALRLPGFSLPIMKYWDGQGLRYVLRNRATGDVYLVVLFTLYLKEDVNEDGSIKPAALQAAGKASGGEAHGGELQGTSGDAFDENKALEEARKHLGEMHVADDKVYVDDGGVD